jgi:phosphatidylglycerol:prolipoprotein diacylglycerol transferase
MAGVHPTFFRLGPWEARAYGVLLGVSFLGGLLFAAWRARRAGLDASRYRWLGLWLFVAILAGSRLAYVLVNPGEFAGRPWRAFWPFEGGVRADGLVMNGGLLGCLLVLVFFARRYRWPVLRVMDTVAPSFALGIFLTRIGCFLNGCCYGLATSAPWGVIFPPDCPAGAYQRVEATALLGGPTPLHPTQLYCSLSGLAIFGVALAAERRWRTFDGFTTFLVLGLYGAARFAVELYRRYDDEVGVWLGLSHNQYLSIILVAGSGAALWVLARRAGAGPAVTP